MDAERQKARQELHGNNLGTGTNFTALGITGGDLQRLKENKSTRSMTQVLEKPRALKIMNTQERAWASTSL